ncbi:uncharacterized protein IL334_002672 [Kwoniella shivajii]|uniref:IPT/TIG domain-containing protein n=1 Tax=Kwoniella shivajii TaxID=564305 RepID=A0ABZ1CVD8_9TREE|nr:hypothetical protein IL334_002672 [Kwoniella shivajii]
MMPTDSSSASTSSPFSTNPSSSSPEGISNSNGSEGSSSKNHLLGQEGYSRSPHDVMIEMQSLLSGLSSTSSYPQNPPISRFPLNHFPSSTPQLDIKPRIPPAPPAPHADIKPLLTTQQDMNMPYKTAPFQQEEEPQHSIPAAADPSRSSNPPELPTPVSLAAVMHQSNQSSVNGSHSHGGLRSDPPKRLYEVDEIRQVAPSLNELTAEPNSTQLLLQGDPIFSDKSRVETAIRVIIDLLRFCPIPSPLPPIHPSLHPLIPRDTNGNFCMSLERITTLQGLKLQAGTTTKASSKKQLQAGPISREHLAYIETAVYMSGDSGKRVYVCKRCRNREAKRRASKEVTRKRQTNSDSDTSSSRPKMRHSIAPPSQDFITGENPDQYDTHRNGQIVEEPPWDPEHRDWRHEIVLFNSPPEVKMEDGSCNWLPFRVVCYGKCHGEKVGFKIKFTLRTWDGRIIATSTTKPIRITDDHKTEPKTKTKIDGFTSAQAQPAVPRARKGRQSTASSRRQSPAPSESESVQSFSEAGAVLQKQTPSVRGAKPYERPPSQSPAITTVPMDSFGANDFQRHNSTASIQSIPQQDVILQQPAPQQQPHMDFTLQQQLTNTVSPGILRGPQFPHNHMNLVNGHQANGQASINSSNLTSPSSSQMMSFTGHDNMLFANSLQSPNSFMSSLSNNGQQSQSMQNSMLFNHDNTDVEMSSAMTGGLDDIFTASSHTSISSMSDGGSVYSTYAEDRSSGMFSDSGIPPTSTNDLDQFLDYTGGDHQDVFNPFQQPDPAMFNTDLSPPPGTNIPPLPFDALHLSPSANRNDLSPAARAEQDQSLTNMLAVIGQFMPPVPQAQITDVIPGEGPTAGGKTIAIAGENFSPGMVVLFGQRPAHTQLVNNSFVKCILPPSSLPGPVEVSIQGAIKLSGQATQIFTYTEMDKDLMRLALEIQKKFSGSSSDPAYRIAHGVVNRSATNSEWSERSSSNSPMSGPSPNDSAEPNEDDDHSDSTNGSKSSSGNLQSTVISFLASLDENAPGSLRASGAINHRNDAQQTLLHIATVMGFHRLVRRLIVVGAHLDLQDTNGFTPLAFAALCGRHTCARVLVEAGASYDRPTSYGEMPLDLAKLADHEKVEALLLSAVWSTSSEAKVGAAQDAELASTGSYDSSSVSEIDNDNPSSGSEVDDELEYFEKLRLSRRRSRRSRATKGKGKQRSLSKSDRERKSPKSTRRPSLTSTSTIKEIQPPVNLPIRDDPPPYAPSESDESSWMSRTLSTIHHPHKIPYAVWDRLPIPHIFGPDKPSTVGEDQHHGWVAFPAPSWETISKMTSPEEVKLFTQAMAAAAFNAVVQSGMTTSDVVSSSETRMTFAEEGLRKFRKARRSNGTGKDGKRSGSVSPSEKVVKHVKRDRMLYLFWLPILLFVGFWLLVSALPLATGFCLIYARQITKAIKQRL